MVLAGPPRSSAARFLPQGRRLYGVARAARPDRVLPRACLDYGLVVLFPGGDLPQVPDGAVVRRHGRIGGALARAMAPGPQVPWGNVKELVEAGFFGMTIPKQYGGQGRSYLDTVLVIDEMAQVCG